jgi:hypothetical protein
MTDAILDQSPAATVQRLVRATNDHDLDRMVACFSTGYVNETPAHPDRGFAGSEQVRTNWRHIFNSVPDLQTRVVRSVFTGDTAWTEWEMSGTRLDGSPHLMRGVIIFGIGEGLVDWARFYLETVETASGDINAAVDEHVGVPR